MAEKRPLYAIASAGQSIVCSGEKYKIIQKTGILLQSCYWIPKETGEEIPISIPVWETLEVGYVRRYKQRRVIKLPKGSIIFSQKEPTPLDDYQLSELGIIPTRRIVQPSLFS